MKKITLLLFVAAFLYSHNAGAQLFKNLKKANQSNAEASGGGSAAEVKIEDEPGSIFGNYYVKYITMMAGSPYFDKELPGQLPGNNQTIQLQRFEQGQDEVVIISWGGIAKAAYTNNDAVCGGCKKGLAGGWIYYRHVPEHKVGSNPLNVGTGVTPKVLTHEIIKVTDDVLMLDGWNDYIILMSKDKTKLDAYSLANYAATRDNARKSFSAAVKKGDNGQAMIKPGNALKAPIFNNARKVAPQLLKKFLEDKGYKSFEPLYAYEKFSSPAFDILKNNLGVETGRQVQFIVVCKNNEVKDANNINKYEFKTKYVSFLVSIRENGSNGSYDGKYYCHEASFGYPIMDTENVMQYK